MGILPGRDTVYRGFWYLWTCLQCITVYLFSVLAEGKADEKEMLLVKEDENQAVKWWTFEEALKVSTEPWMVGRVYKKLIEKSR